jgi:hypothetical protein
MKQAHRKRDLTAHEGVIEVDGQPVETISRVAPEVEQSIARLVEEDFDRG